VHANYGRAAQIDISVHDSKSAFEAVSRMAELFGRIDVVIDAKMRSLSPDKNASRTSQLLLEQVTPFFRSKKRGRIVFIREDQSAGPLLPDGLTSELAETFFPWSHSLSQNWPAPNFGVNSVAVGLTEDLLLKKFPHGKSIRASLENLQKEHPGLQMVDSHEVTSVVLFLASVASSGLTGQTLRVKRAG